MSMPSRRPLWIALTVAAAGLLVGIGLCGAPMKNEDFGDALIGAVLIVASGVGALVVVMLLLRRSSERPRR